MRRLIKKFTKKYGNEIDQESLVQTDYENEEVTPHQQLSPEITIKNSLDEENQLEDSQYEDEDEDEKDFLTDVIKNSEENDLNQNPTTEVPAEYLESFSEALQTIIRNDFEGFKNIIEANPLLLGFHTLEDGESSSLLYKTLIFNRIEIADVILGFDDNNYSVKSGTTALHIAASINNKAMCEVILKHGANVNTRNLNGFTAFESAVICKCFDVAQLLLDRGSNINGRNKYGFTTLDNASSHGDIDEMEFLLKNAAAVNTADQFGNTPLHSAVKTNSIDACKLLLEHGAKADVKDKFDKAPSDYATDLGFEEIVQLLANVSQ